MSRTSSSIQLSLPARARRHLNAQVAAGRSSSPNEYVLRLIEEDRQIAADEAALKEALEVGLRQLREGKGKTYHSVEELLAEVRKRGMRRLKRMAK